MPADQLLGAEGQGFVNALQVLDAGRIGIAALVGRPGAGRVRGRARYALSARQFGSRSARSRRSAGSWPTMRRGSRPRGC